MRTFEIEREVISVYLLPGERIPRIFHARDSACQEKHCFKASKNLPFRCLGLDDLPACAHELDEQPEPQAILVRTWPGGEA
jgi:hypothetical protein